MRELLVHPNTVALVDDDVWEWASLSKWYLSGDRPAGRYISRRLRLAPGRYTREYLHRLIVGAKPGDVVDHKNLSTYDNQRTNLRICTITLNAANQRKTRGTSRYKGVSIVRKNGKWQASIRVNGKTQHIGYYFIEEDAARAYDAEAIRLWGEFALTNAKMGLL